MSFFQALLTQQVIQARDIEFSNFSTTGFTISWKKGSFGKRIVVLTADEDAGAVPTDTTTYTANTSFGSGTALGDGFVVYNGTGNSVTITNLTANTEYHAQVFEYSGAAGSEVYKTESARRNPNHDFTFTTEYAAVLSRATTLGYTHPSLRQQYLQNRLLRTYKTMGVFANFEVFYVPLNDGSLGFGTLNWVAPSSYQLTLVNAPSWTSNLGFTGNGTSSYLNTNFTPSTNLAVGSQNNLSIGVYCAAGGQSSGMLMGSVQTSPARRLSAAARNTSDLAFTNINDNTTLTAANGEAVGLYHFYRDNSTLLNYYRNGVSVSTSFAATSTGLNSNNIYLLARNNAGVADLFSAQTLGMAWIGSSMSIYTNAINVAFNYYREAVDASTVQQPFGEVFNDSFARSFLNAPNKDFIAGANFTVDGSKLNVVSGVGGFNDRLQWRYGNSFEKYVQTIAGQFNSTPGAGTYGIGVGLSDFTTPDVQRSVVARLELRSGSDLGKIYIYSYDGTTATAEDVSASGLPFVSGDLYEVELTSDVIAGERVYTAIATRNGGSTVQAQWTTAVNQGSSTGNFAIFNFGGTFTVTNWTIAVNDLKNVNDIIIGDSITHGFGATDLNTRWAAQISDSYLVSAGNGDGTGAVMQKLKSILDTNARRAFLMIGGNDITFGILSTAQSNYTILRNFLQASGVQVIHCLATPRDATNMTTWNAWLTSTWTSDLIIDTFTPLSDGGTGLDAAYDFDGTHLNQAGNDLVAATILAAL